MKLRVRLAAAGALGALAAACQISSEAPAATPQRPTVSSDTATVPEGTFEVELGASLDPDGPFSTPLTLEYGSGPRTQVFLGLNPLQRVEVARDEETGFGDLVVGLRHRFADETADRPSLAVQSTIKLPTADEERGLGSGELDAGFAAIATRAVGAGSVTAYYELDVLGDPAGGTDLGHVLALAGGHPIEGQLGAGLELSGLLVPEQDSEMYFARVYFTYALVPSCVLDLGLAAGLNDEAPDAALLVGLTRNLGPQR